MLIVKVHLMVHCYLFIIVIVEAHIMLNEFELRSAAVDPKKCNTLSERQNCKQYQAMQFFFHLLSLPKQKYVYSLLSFVPVLHSQL